MDYRVPHCLVVSSFQNFLTQKQSPAFQRSRTVYHHYRRPEDFIQTKISVQIHKAMKEINENISWIAVLSGIEKNKLCVESRSITICQICDSDELPFDALLIASRLEFSITVAITYRVHDFENFDENFVQGTISPLLKSHIPLDGSVSLFKYLPTELKRI